MRRGPTEGVFGYFAALDRSKRACFGTRAIQEERVATTTGESDIQAPVAFNGALVGTSISWEYYRGTAERKKDRWLCFSPPVPGLLKYTQWGSSSAVDPYKEYLYTDGLSPDFSSLDEYKPLVMIRKTFGVTSTTRFGTCLQLPHAAYADRREHIVAALPLLELLRAEAFKDGGFSYNVWDRNVITDPAHPWLSSGAVVLVSNRFIDAITQQLKEALGTQRATWRVRLNTGTLIVEPHGLPEPQASYLLLGRVSVAALASNEKEITELGQPPANGGSFSWEEALAIPLVKEPNVVTNARIGTIPKIFGDDHPVRNAQAWEILCDSSFAIPACTDPVVADGATFADDIFLLRERIPSGGVDAAGIPYTVTRPVTIYLYHEYDSCPADESCFRVKNGRYGLIVDYITPAAMKYGREEFDLYHYRDGVLERAASRIIERDRQTCAEPRYNSLGIARKIVPPLENELNDNLDPYESSFKDYLNRARDAAAAAADLVAAASATEHALQQDMTRVDIEAENLVAEANESIESICGPGSGEVGCAAVRNDRLVREIGASEGTDLLPEPLALVAVGSIASGDNNAVITQCRNELMATGTPGALPPGYTCSGAVECSILNNLLIPGQQSPVDAMKSSLEDLQKMAQCAAVLMVDGVRESVVRGLPEVFDDGELSFDDMSRFGGRYLQTLLGIDAALIEFRNAVISVTTAMQSLSARLEAAEYRIDSLVTSSSGKAGDLLAGLAGSIQGGLNVGGALGWATGIGSLAGGFLQAKDNYRKEAAAANAVVQELTADVLQTMGNIQLAGNSMELAINRVLGQIEELALLELEQQHARNRAERQIELLSANVNDQVVWRTLSRANLQARKALRRAKVHSFIAKRAIEFRLAVDLNRETGGTAIVDPPMRWANDIFNMEDRAASLHANAGSGPQADDDPYFRATVEYVQRLDDFVMSYPFQYPFQGNGDTAVLSMKDDIIQRELGCDTNGVPVDQAGNLVSGACLCVNDDPFQALDATMLAAELGNNGGGPITDFAGDCASLNDGTTDSFHVEVPYDFDGAQLRRSLLVKCKGATGLQRGVDGCGGGEVEYYQIDFNISLTGIEAGRLARQGQIASGRYNYRLDDVTVNLVGSNVKDCSLDPTATCFANAFIPFTLIHSGEVVQRDHDMVPHTYAMHAARIESGKALAAERYLTSPIASADAALIEQYRNTELRGRPLQGVYSLRLKNVRSLAISELEDVQLLIRYRSWTPFEAMD